MFDWYLIVPLAAGAFVATNMDNFVLLVALLSQYGDAKKSILLGYGAGIATLLALSYLIASAADNLPVTYLGLLGIVPLALGAYGLLDLIRHRHRLDDYSKSTLPAGRPILLASALIQVSNGTDTVITLSALMTDSVSAADPLIIISCATAAAVLALLATYALSHQRFESAIRRYAPRVTPFILIGVGLYILANTATDLVTG